MVAGEAGCGTEDELRTRPAGACLRISRTAAARRAGTVAPIEYTQKLSCPLLGLFGNEDRAPTPEQVDQHEAELKKYGKQYEVHRYDGAGHGFFYYDRPAYRIEQAVDGWKKVFAFLEKHLSA